MVYNSSDPIYLYILAARNSGTCIDYIDGYEPSYGYVPSLGVGITFLVLFGLSALVHLVQMCWKRTWWTSVFVIGAIAEILGWSARTWSARCPYSSTAFLMQISTLIIAPTFFTAGIYIILGRLITLASSNAYSGEKKKLSIITPKMYLWIFCTCDILSLVIQAIGGGMASGESNKVGGDTKPGTDVMVAGIVFQLATITIFCYFFVDFLLRSQRVSSSIFGRSRWIVGATVLSVVTIYIRSIYRTIELVQGWDGYLITRERYFGGLDGAMMVIAVGVFNCVHPGWALPKAHSSAEGMDEIVMVSEREGEKA
ncbi:RTA1-domain-containing protein [Saitoella complicata NRRL Y-17804]|nr:RTA1-domain-containing protein [Saitoella complicata NRRL Y-17804]ODQ52269.1 RTA1-domain-containing protein [Saitoella complicata NRRL Y-17804]